MKDIEIGSTSCLVYNRFLISCEGFFLFMVLFVNYYFFFFIVVFLVWSIIVYFYFILISFLNISVSFF